METDPLPDLAEDFPAHKRWADYESVTLEVAVMLSLGIDPEIWDNFEPALEWNDDEGEFEAETPHFGVHHQDYHYRKKVFVTGLRHALNLKGEKHSGEIIVKLEEFVKLAVKLGWSLPKWLSKGYGQRGAPEGPNPTTATRNEILVTIGNEVIREHPEKLNSDLAKIIARRFCDKHKDLKPLNHRTVCNILFNLANAHFKNYRPNSEASE